MSAKKILGALMLIFMTVNAYSQTMSIRLDSDPNDQIGRGIQETVDERSGNFSIFRDSQRGLTIKYYAARNYNELYSVSITFQAPPQRRLNVGPYPNVVVRQYGHSGAAALLGFDFRHNSFGSDCAEEDQIGEFQILEAVYGPGAEVQQFAADFTLRCQNSFSDPDGGELRGSVRLNASSPPFPPPPDSDNDGVADTVDNCLNVVNPDQVDDDNDRFGNACDTTFTDTYITVESPPNHPIGGQYSDTLYLTDAVITTALESDYVSSSSPFRNGLIQVGTQRSEDYWTFTFAAANRLLIAGPYPAASGLSFERQITDYIRVERNNHSCVSDLGQGSFEIFELLINNQKIERLALDFEYQCGEAGALMRGSIRINSSAPPFSSPPDNDDDGIVDSIDNCLAQANPQQIDTDADGQGDACDAITNLYRLSIDSSPGDTLGLGFIYNYDVSNSQFYIEKIAEYDIISFVEINPTRLRGVAISFHGHDYYSPSWSIRFSTTPNQPFGIGIYNDAGFSHNGFPEDRPMLDIRGPGYCGHNNEQGNGSFEILELEISPQNTVSRFAATFQSRCPEAPAGLSGKILFNASSEDGGGRLFNSGFEQLQ